MKEKGKILILKEYSIKNRGQQALLLNYSSSRSLLPQFINFYITKKGDSSEISILDNSMDIVLPPSTKKYKSICIIGAPDWDFMFFNRRLKKMLSVDIDYIYQNVNKTDYAILSSKSQIYNLIILFKPDFNLLPIGAADKIFSQYLLGKSSIIYFTGIDVNKLPDKTLNSIGVNIDRKKNAEPVKGILQLTGNNRFFMPLIEWQKFPAFNNYLKIQHAHYFTQYLINSTDSNSLFAVAESQVGNALALITADGFYRWEFDMGMLDNEAENIKNFWSALLNYFFNKSIEQDILITANPAGYIFEKYSKPGADIILSSALQNKSDKLNFYISNSIYTNKKILRNSLLADEVYGINKIEARLEELNKKHSIEYFITHTGAERLSDLNIDIVKNNFFNNRIYYNFLNTEDFFKNYKSLIKPQIIENKIIPLRNLYFFIILFILFCGRWWALKK